MLWELLAAGPDILILGSPFLGIPAERLSDKSQWETGKFIQCTMLPRGTEELTDPFTL